jgi:hypothetical protein
MTPEFCSSNCVDRKKTELGSSVGVPATGYKARAQSCADDAFYFRRFVKHVTRLTRSTYGTILTTPPLFRLAQCRRPTRLRRSLRNLGQSTLIYCGMSGRSIETAVEAAKSKYGLITRLATRARGRLSGDQFSVYLANRIVIPSLNRADLVRFASGELTLDSKVKAYVQERLVYQYAIVEGSKAAFELELRCRSGEVFGAKPYLNPA